MFYINKLISFDCCSLINGHSRFEKARLQATDTGDCNIPMEQDL